MKVAKKLEILSIIEYMMYAKNACQQQRYHQPEIQLF